MPRLLILLVTLVAAGCGSDTPLAPTPPPPANIAGTWSGTVQYTIGVGGSLGVQAIGLNLTQAAGSVNGTYAAQNFGGTVTGTTTSTAFSGTLTFNTSTTTGAPCTGTFAVSGTAGGATMNWTSPAVTASCSGTPVGLTIAIQRR